jgi:hypothetical protein
MRRIALERWLRDDADCSFEKLHDFREGGSAENRFPVARHALEASPADPGESCSPFSSDVGTRQRRRG